MNNPGRRRERLVVLRLAIVAASLPAMASATSEVPSRAAWIGTWATAAQPALPSSVQRLHDQTLRLIVHTSVGGPRARIRISNTYGDEPLRLGSAHVARRTRGAEIDPASDRRLTFGGQSATSVAARSTVVSDPVDLAVPALCDLAISLFLPDATVSTSHLLARQTSYVSSEGDFTASVELPVARTIRSWPFLTGVDVAASPHGAAIVAFGSSLTDGDGSSLDANRRWPDLLAQRLQEAGGRRAELGVLNLGIIGNRLLFDSPRHAGSPFGGALGESGLARLQRDVLDQAGVRYLVVGLGINDIAFPGFPFTPPEENVRAEDVIAGYRRLIARAHRAGIVVIGTTIPPFEDSVFTAPPFEGLTFYTPEREAVRAAVNTWIRGAGAFDAVVDFDLVLRDPRRPTRMRPDYDSGDHLHPNDAGYTAKADAVPLSLFDRRR